MNLASHYIDLRDTACIIVCFLQRFCIMYGNGLPNTYAIYIYIRKKERNAHRSNLVQLLIGLNKSDKQ